MNWRRLSCPFALSCPVLSYCDGTLFFLPSSALDLTHATFSPYKHLTIIIASPKLMSKAIKYSDFIAKSNGRKLDEEEQEFEVTGSYTIQPQECLTFI